MLQPRPPPPTTKNFGLNSRVSVTLVALIKFQGIGGWLRVWVALIKLGLGFRAGF